MLVGLCQLNPTVGALEANADRIIEAYREVAAQGARLAVFGELAICGYPPEDLVLKQQFLADCRAQLERIAAVTGDCAAIVGFPERGAEDQQRHNSAAVCRNGRVELVYRKQVLPTYDVFDEERWFEPGTADQPCFEVDGVTVGVVICEDAWYPDGPAAHHAAAGARLLVDLNASPFHEGRLLERTEMLERRVAETGCTIVYVNQVGGQDDLVFDGGSMVVGPGRVLHRIPQFDEVVTVVDTDVPGSVVEPLERVAEIWSALVTGTRDYVRKNGFTDVVIGLSGGVDSSLVAALAVDALGAEHVHGVLMPSRYSSDHSVTDAELLSQRLGIEHRTIPIEEAHAAFLRMLAPSFGEAELGLTEENLQSRIRGVTLMALSNQFGWMVLTTGNKSESAVGYSTLYGDTAGAIAVIKDVYKLTVYELCRYRNRRGDGEVVIPANVLTKPPSAELRPDQLDEHSLPPYEVLDPLLEAYIDGNSTSAELVAAGFDPELVARIIRLVDLAEYKRRQSPLGIRVMRTAFGRDRRLPITNAYR